jgi:uncharacterized protein (DUF608 family)
MKIKHIGGSVVDTDKLGDLEAELMEKTQAYLDFCVKNNIPFILRYYFPFKKYFSGVQYFGDNHENSIKNYDLLFRCLDADLKKVNSPYRIVAWDKVKHLFEEGE